VARNKYNSPEFLEAQDLHRKTLRPIDFNVNPHTCENGGLFWHDSDRKHHRTDGPAIIHLNGVKIWMQHGECHCTDGPAIIDADGIKSWYLHDKELTLNAWLAVNTSMTGDEKVMFKLENG
jgi:hypothetical protein